MQVCIMSHNYDCCCLYLHCWSYLQVEEERDEDEANSLSDSTAEVGLSQFRINDILAPSYLPSRVLEKVCTYIHTYMYILPYHFMYISMWIIREIHRVW